MIINFTTIIGTLVGIVLGAVICALILKNKANTLKINLENTQRQLEETKANAQADLDASEARWNSRLLEMKTDEHKHYEESLEAKDKANSEAMQALKEHYDKSIQAQQERFEETMSKIAEQNKAATEDMLKARQKEFAESSSANIGQIVNPLKETIAKMEEAMQKSSKEAVSMNSAMKENRGQSIIVSANKLIKFGVKNNKHPLPILDVEEV